MKFAHMGDCHIGAWRDPQMRNVNIKAFVKAIDMCVSESVDFVLISGDLFNNPLPAIDNLKIVTTKLKELKDKNIPVYAIAGSHDFSPSGKTILDVLEKAGLLINVVKGNVVDNKLKLEFTIDPKTGIKITGMLGKKGMLEKSYYETLDRENLESEEGYKIFMFHTALTELKPKELEKMISSPVSFLPKTFNYYAGGHVHIVKESSLEGYKNLVYPGPLFPNSFSELEKLNQGGFYIIENDILEYKPITINNHINITIDCSHNVPEKIEQELKDKIRAEEFHNAIVTIRLKGIMESGKIGDIGFKDIFSMLYEKGAYFVMKSTSLLRTKEFKDIKISSDSVEELENALIKEHLGQTGIFELDKEEKLVKELIKLLGEEKIEGERVIDFETRIKRDSNELLGI